MHRDHDWYFRDKLRRLRSAGHVAHAQEFEGVVRALRVIRTWASVDGVLDAENVMNLADKVLKPFTSPEKQRKNNDD